MSMQASNEAILYPGYLNQFYIKTPPKNMHSKYLNHGRLSQEGLAMVNQAQMNTSNGFSRRNMDSNLLYSRGNSDQHYHQQALEELQLLGTTNYDWNQDY